MTIIYRILSIIINSVAMLLAISMVFSLPMIFSSPQTMLPGFMMAAVILYSWFSFKFRREVLQQQKVVGNRLRDWVRVNGIVTLVFSLFTIMGIVPLLQNPQSFLDVVKTMGVDMPVQTALNFFYAMLIYGVVLFIHILWTFALMKKNKEFFQ